MARQVGHWAARINRTKKSVGIAHGFRSGLEEKNAQRLEDLGQVVRFETMKIPYLVPETRHHYTADFPLANGIIVETKGRFMPQDRAKHLFIKTQYPELDIRLVFQNPRAKINPGSKTTYADWADKHGIVWAEKIIPEEWVREQGPVRKPEEVLKDGPYGYLKHQKEAA